MHPPLNLAHEIANNPDRFVSSLGIDPSTEIGANLLACRLRLYWLQRGFYVPATVQCTVRASTNGVKTKRLPVYSASLVTTAAQRVTEAELPALKAAIEAEIQMWLNEVKTPAKVAA